MLRKVELTVVVHLVTTATRHWASDSVTKIRTMLLPLMGPGGISGLRSDEADFLCG